MMSISIFELEKYEGSIVEESIVANLRCKCDMWINCRGINCRGIDCLGIYCRDTNLECLSVNLELRAR